MNTVIRDAVIKHAALQLDVPESRITMGTRIPDMDDLLLQVSFETGRAAMANDLPRRSTVQDAIEAFFVAACR